MQGIDAFLDTYVCIDEGTAVLLCAHRSCARTAAWLYAAIFMRGTEPVALCFDDDDRDADIEIRAGLASLRARASFRRIVVIVCEPGGPSFEGLLAAEQGGRPEKMPIYRISGSSSSLRELGNRTPMFGHRMRSCLDAEFAGEEMLGDTSDADEPGLSESDIAELLDACDSEMAALDDRELEEIASMSEEEIGSLTDEELAALAELEDSELLELALGWGDEEFRVLA